MIAVASGQRVSWYSRGQPCWRYSHISQGVEKMSYQSALMVYTNERMKEEKYQTANAVKRNNKKKMSGGRSVEINVEG